VPRGEDLGDATARVVGNQVDVGECEAVADVFDQLGQRAHGEVLVRTRGCLAVQRQVDGDAAPLGLEVVDDVAPQERVGTDAVDEQGDAASADVDGADVAGAGADGAAMAVEFVQMHTRRVSIGYTEYRLTVCL
jgi:hypothetical protein